MIGCGHQIAGGPFLLDQQAVVASRLGPAVAGVAELGQGFEHLTDSPAIAVALGGLQGVAETGFGLGILSKLDIEIAELRFDHGSPVIPIEFVKEPQRRAQGGQGFGIVAELHLASPQKEESGGLGRLVGEQLGGFLPGGHSLLDLPGRFSLLGLFDPVHTGLGPGWRQPQTEQDDENQAAH